MKLPGSKKAQAMTGRNDRCEGMWQRLLLSRPGEPVDTLVRTEWLQGPALYADLRQPPAVHRTITATCLADLQPEDARLLACQEGFAGRFEVIGDVAEWHRSIDFQAAAPLGDRGRLVREDGLIIEYGVEADYIEYWQLEPQAADTPSASARFISEADGRAVILVQHGCRFAYARDRGQTLPAGASLGALLCDTDATEAQALVDCEVSFGTVTADGWRIERSTLPWREGAILLLPDAGIAAARLTVADVNAQGQPMDRELRLVELYGTFSFAPAEAAAPVADAPATDARPATAIPVIDIAALGGPDAIAEAAVVEQIRKAASDTGFFHITGHGIASAVTERLKGAARRFFELPEKRKLASYIGKSTNHRGYVPVGEEVLSQYPEPGRKDLKEAFDLALDLPAERVPAGHPMLGPNQWPDLPGFREDVMGYYAAVFAVGRRLLRGFAMALGQPATAFDHLVITPPSQLRLIHYPFQPDAQDVAGIGAHTDYECFTLLLPTAPGLEVMNQAGEWIDAPPVPDGLVVNIGDMMEYWSGGKFVATSHRVRKVAEERWSFPLFFALDYDVELRPLGSGEDAIRTGEHLFAQTAQTFRYLRDRADRGEIALPQGSRPLSTFGQEARHRNSDPA